MQTREEEILLMKRFIKLFFTSLLLLICVGCASEEALATPYYIDGYTYDDLPLIQDIISQEQDKLNAAHQMAENARKLDYSDEHDIIQIAKIEYSESEGKVNYYLEIRDKLQAKWAEKEKEYPEATYIWSYLKKQGYSNEVCAGILGNCMREVADNNLNLNPYAVSSSGFYYGICQWNKKVYSSVWNKDLAYQCDFLVRTIRYEMDTFTTAGYDRFLLSNSPQEAAKLFFQGYERGNASTLKQRQKNAVVAYDYFVS